MGTPLYFRSDSSLEHETGPHPEGPGRIPAIEAELERRDWLGFERVDAPRVSPEALTAVHPQAYVDSVREMSERGGGAFDADTIASPGSYEAALHAAGGACALVDALLSGDTPTGFCGLRPPGHHAEHARAMGFCLFNNVAVAARHALDGHGLKRVFVLDWDVHHGNGTNDIFYETDAVLFASIHQWPLYPGTGQLCDTGAGAGEGYTINLPVPAGAGDSTWLPLVEHVVVPAARAYEPDLILVSAGFDAHRDDPLASCRLTDESFAAMARWVVSLGSSLGVPVGGVLEGGYDLDALAASVAATLGVLGAGDGAVEPVDPDPVTQKAQSHFSRWWPVAA
jgi:acetoin utilization deacetylase AcuC-like enzyme